MTRLRTDRRAVAAVEMALAATLLVPLCAFTVEAGQALLNRYKLSRSLHAGLMYAWAVPTNATTASIQNAATAGFQSTTNSAFSATAQLLYYCIDPTTGIHGSTTTTAGASCSGAGTGYVLGTWVNLVVTTSVPTIFTTFAQGSTSWSLSASGTARIQ